ncbi:MAG TPA: 4-(cytidine 5'-diphospho)-2-C-methyl-D-erythritol kinase [Candidatus Acidoferrales bacterium]|nr:4-(cytidine 5'-diphospho)-2-C-methyl-D-erythritol kinase [Candidatus Acidoferrales bacterium]
MTVLAERACAKINLFLRVTGRRENGYHELDSIFLPISFADEVRVEAEPADETLISLDCNVAALASSRSNLASRAARAFMREFNLTATVRITLVKNIPVGSGLGGGSSDAGTVLRIMAQMVPEVIREEPARLHDIALSLGADVPFFLDPQPSRVTGVGERIEPLPAMPSLPLVVAVPPFEVATADVFRALDPAGWSGAAPDTDIAAIVRGEITPATTVNDLAPVAIGQFREIGRLKALLEESGARAAQMSGSGGAVFGVFATLEEAQAAAATVKRRAPFATVVPATSLAGESAAA